MNLPIEIIFKIIDISFHNKDTTTLYNLQKTNNYFDNYITKKCKKLKQIDKGMKHFLTSSIKKYERKCVLCDRYCKSLVKIDKSNIFIIKNKYQNMNINKINMHYLFHIMNHNIYNQTLYYCYFDCIENPFYITYKNKHTGGYIEKVNPNILIKYKNVKCQNLFLYRLCKVYLFELYCSNPDDYKTVKDFLDKITN
jgi:hypothetical protein